MICVRVWQGTAVHCSCLTFLKVSLFVPFAQPIHWLSISRAGNEKTPT